MEDLFHYWQLTYGDKDLHLEKMHWLRKHERLDAMIELEKSPSSSFSVLSVTATDPSFAKKLAEVVLAELEDLNRFFKSRSVNEKQILLNREYQTLDRN